VSIGRRSVGHTSWMRMYGEPAPAPNAVVRPGSGCQNLLAVNGGHTLLRCEFPRSPAIPNTWVRRLDSLACCTPGIKNCCIIPHVHCVVPAGGLAPDYSRWIPGRHNFFLPVKVLSRVFRGKFVAGLRDLHAAGQLGFHGGLHHLQKPQAFAAFLRPLFRSDWVVYSKRPFGGAEHALQYLGCYTHRVAISNHRLVSLEQGRVTFRWTRLCA
jgi:hypothetical protein